MMENWIPIVQRAHEEAAQEDKSTPSSSASQIRKSVDKKPKDKQVKGEEQEDAWSVTGQMFVHQYKGGLKGGAATIANGQGGAASTNWSVNLSEEVAILWFAQLVDDLGWDDLKDKEMQDLWTVVNKGFKDKVAEFKRPAARRSS